MTLRSLLFALAAPGLLFSAEPLSRSLEIDFARDVLSRDLKGLATRSDGRLLPGPRFTDLDGPAIGEVLWALQPAGGARFIIGTGPTGAVVEVKLNAKDLTYTTQVVGTVKEAHATAVSILPDDSVLAGAAPGAALYVLKGGTVQARVPLPADSVFDLLPLPDGSVLASTGNPGRIYRIDPRRLSAAGIVEGTAKDGSGLDQRGITVFGEVRDRNLRRLARLADGRIAAGSAPRGTLYAFPAAGGAPVVLHEQRDAEIVDLLPEPDGGVIAAIVTNPPGEDKGSQRIVVTATPAAANAGAGAASPAKEDTKTARPAPSFSGRSNVVRISGRGLVETLTSRANTAIYRLARHDKRILLFAGEQGDVYGLDLEARRTLVFAGSAAAQLNDVAPLDRDRLLVLRNNAPGLAVMAFAAQGARSLETKRLDLGSAATLGNLRLDRTRGLSAAAVKAEIRTNLGSDEIEGWSPWMELPARDGGFYASGLHARHVKLRLTFAADAADFQVDKASLFHLPQNRRPQLADFRLFPANVGLIPQPDATPQAVVTSLNQWLSTPGAGRGDGPRRNTAGNSQVVPAPGTQLIYWSVTDPDGDNLTTTFSIRQADVAEWTDLKVNTTDPYCQFEVGHLPEGLYFTRLRVDEQAPRPADERLSYSFETDALVVDRTPPVITGANVRRADGNLRVEVSGRDALSLLDGAEFNFNQGVSEATAQPADGIRDGREETFVIEVPLARAAGATSVEVLLYDQAGNAASTRLPIPP